MGIMYSVGSGPLLVNSQGIPYSTPAPPPAANILNGTASTDGATILTLPANSTALVTISLSAAVTSASTSATPSVTLTGTGSTPATGATLASLAIRSNAGQSLANSSLVFNNIYIYSGSTTATLKLNFNSATAAVAVVNGALII